MLKNMSKHYEGVTYSLIAGIIPTVVLGYIISRFLGIIFEQLGMESYTGVVLISTPVIAPIIGGLLFIKYRDDFDLSPWTVLLTSVTVGMLIDLFFYFFDPLWLGLGIIVGLANGVVLSVLYILARK